MRVNRRRLGDGAPFDRRQRHHLVVEAGDPDAACRRPSSTSAAARAPAPGSAPSCRSGRCAARCAGRRRVTSNVGEPRAPKMTDCWRVWYTGPSQISQTSAAKSALFAAMRLLEVRRARLLFALECELDVRLHPDARPREWRRAPSASRRSAPCRRRLRAHTDAIRDRRVCPPAAAESACRRLRAAACAASARTAARPIPSGRAAGRRSARRGRWFASRPACGSRATTTGLPPGADTSFGVETARLQHLRDQLGVALDVRPCRSKRSGRRAA